MTIDFKFNEREFPPLPGEKKLLKRMENQSKMESSKMEDHICKKCNSIIFTHCINCIKNKKHAAGVLIYTSVKGEPFVLMGRASKNKPVSRRHKIEFFGGVSENNETPYETITRETYEETLGAINVKENKLENICTTNNKNGKDYLLCLYKMDYKPLIYAMNKFNMGDKPDNVEVDKLVLISAKKVMSNIHTNKYNLIDVNMNYYKISNFAISILSIGLHKLTMLMQA